MTSLFLLEPDAQPAWAPFAACRPVAELRAGIWLIRERWEALIDGPCAAIFGPPHLHGFVEGGMPPVAPVRVIEGPALIGRSDFAPSGHPIDLPATAARLTNEGETVGWWVPEGASWDGPHAAFADAAEVDGLRLLGAFDLVTALEHFLPPDAADFTNERGDPVPDGLVVLGDPDDIVVLGAAVEPGVLLDVRRGPIILEHGAYVRAQTRLEGPLYVGAGTEVFGGDIRHSVVGPQCRIRGELAHTVFLGHSNKAHDGFVGHSVVGRWVNLGAGTITSNLKNTYGPIQLDADGARVTTWRQNLGALFGDHAKVAIGTLFGTGSIVGVGANVFGWTRPPRHVAPFAWGDTGETMRLDGFLAVAARVLPRREVEFTDEVRASLERIYAHAVDQ